MKKPFLTIPQFSPSAKKLRGYFHDQFENPHQAQAKRFVWDYWYVKDQYRHMRTPAYHYFPQKIYRDFHVQLIEWGRQNLGCHNISPPWLSYYVDGHYQKLHADVPHGPWAFVYSLTPPKKFTGGQTLIMKDSVLDYWNNFSDVGTESKHFFDEVEPKFNQLLIFDARYPHGVEEVRNAIDPLDGRLVIHGWFVEPRPYVVGGLTTSQVQRSLGAWLDDLSGWLAADASAQFLGTLTLRLQISSRGKAGKIEILTSTVLHMQDRTRSLDLQKYVSASLKNVLFPAVSKQSFLTIPLVFK